mmetsp:Transcript_4988/g.18739  ORF Transcript_4988/g.18739 Transcript_4988/m.18739 type:complete len:969 (-) Transcript_4988:1282-4188(-)|eukprot:CAMPEP_0117443386 /NCGR_PEP_ID=MMETSP0759-20121206/4668_1 /TAXON_ID=63605 /ORGANISM="Percolomonas cosmopolitus, Strain WS" /LENGTH=968 /DNA_ID=CAMNT_0005235359 /DNA_START=523 /DNA_END=3429 /DNA_ORIENTATION=+
MPSRHSSHSTSIVQCSEDLPDDENSLDYAAGGADSSTTASGSTQTLRRVSSQQQQKTSSPRPTFTLSVPKNGTGLPMQIPGPEHISWIPPDPEDTYQVTDTLVAKMVLHDSQRLANPHTLLNRVVFDCIDPSPMHQLSASHQFSYNNRMRGSMTPGQLMPYYIPMSKDDNTLVFESRFESGNLRRAIQVYEYEYDLILKFDVNTRGHTQWFFFSVKNARKGVTYKFNLINLLKPDSLYNYGMKPLIYSENDAKNKKKGWYRGGQNICYYQNNIKRKNGYFYTLTFSHTFENDNDLYYFAYCYPYTYTDLQHYLNNLEADPFRRKLFRRRTLCHSLAGNNVDLLTVTSFSCDPLALKNRKGVVVTARVHPGESNSSFLVKGVMDYLTGPSVDAKILRDNFVFKIVPMLNPDGVINGNYRCSLSGSDLNRKYLEPSIKLHPTIFHTKEMIRKFNSDREVILYCDMHGHSRKKNIFMYGCPRQAQGSKRLSTRVFPRILWKISQNFSFEDSSFGISRQKESTGRVVMNKEIGIINSYTMEASFCGSSFGKLNNKHFSTKHLEQMGHFFCEAILDLCDPDQTRVKQITRELEVLYPENGYIPHDTDSMGSDDEASETASDPNGVKKKRKKKSSKKQKTSGKSRKNSTTSSTSATVVSSTTTTSSKKRESSASRKSKSRSAGSRSDSQTSGTVSIRETASTSTFLNGTPSSTSSHPKKKDKERRRDSSVAVSSSSSSGANTARRRKSSVHNDRPSTARSGSSTARRSSRRQRSASSSNSSHSTNDTSSARERTEIDIDSSTNSDDGVTVNIQIRTSNSNRSRVILHTTEDSADSDSGSGYSSSADPTKPSLMYQSSSSYQRFKNRLIESETKQAQNNRSTTLNMRRHSGPIRDGQMRTPLTPSVYRSDIAMSLGNFGNGASGGDEELPRITRGRSRSQVRLRRGSSWKSDGVGAFDGAGPSLVIRPHTSSFRQ